MKRPLLILLMLIFVIPTWIQAQPYYYALEPIKVGNLAPRIKRSSPFVVGDKIITIKRAGNLIAAVNANNGSILWETPLGGVAVADVLADWRRIYIATGERSANFFIAIDLVSGRRAYYTQLPGEADRSYNSRLIQVGDLILVPVEGGVLAAYNKDDGKEAWVVELPGSIEVMVAKDDTVYLGCEKHLVALRGESGEILWDQKFGTEIAAIGVVEDDLLMGMESTLYFIDRTNGQILASITLKGGKVVAGEIPHVGNRTYVMTTGGYLNIVDVEERKIKDFPRLAKNAFDQPLIAGKALVFWSRNEGIFVYDLNEGVQVYIPEYSAFKPIFRVRLDQERWSLVFLNYSGHLMSIKLPRAGFVVRKLKAYENLTVFIEGVVSLYSNDTIVPTIEVRSPDGDLLWLEKMSSVTPLLRTRRTRFRFTLSKPFSYVELKVLMDEGNLSWIHRIELPYEEAVVPPPVAGSATFAVHELKSLIVGEPFEISGSLTVNVKGELELLLIGEKIISESISLGWVDAGAEKIFSVQTVPIIPGDISIKLVAKLNGSEIGETTVRGTCVQGSVIEEVSPSSINLKEGDTIKLKVKVKNRLLDGALLRIEASSNLTSKEAANVGPLKAGEEKEVSLTLTALKSGSSQIMVKVFHKDKLVEEALVEVSVEPVVQTPPPTPIPTSPLESLWKVFAPITSLFEPYLGTMGSRIVVLGLIAGIPLAVFLGLTKLRKREEKPVPKVVEEIKPERVEIIRPKPEEVEMTRPKPVEVEEIPVLPPERPGVEIEIPTIQKELELRLDELAERLKSLRQRAEAMENEGFTGLVDRAESIRRLIDDVRIEIAERRYDYAKQLMDRLQSNMISLDRHLESLEELLGSWNKIEGRIKMMLSLWGRAPASLLTTIPENLRIIALTRFARLHPEMRLELKDDELILMEE